MQKAKFIKTIDTPGRFKGRGTPMLGGKRSMEGVSLEQGA